MMDAYINYFLKLEKKFLVITRLLIETLIFTIIYLAFFVYISPFDGTHSLLHVGNIGVWLLCYMVMGLHLDRLRYSSLVSYLPVIKASLFMSLLLTIENFIFRENFASVLLFSFFLCLLNSLVGFRIIARQFIRKNSSRKRDNIIVYGTQTVAVDFINSLTFSKKYNVVGVLADTTNNPITLAGLPVIDWQQLSDFANHKNCKLIVLASEIENSEIHSEILLRLDKLGFSVSYVPTLDKAFDYEVKLKAVKPEQVLGRSINHDLDVSTVSELAQKTIFITGAGGSIGSELCEQVLRYRPSRLILLELSELALYNLEQQLRKVCIDKGYDTEIIYYLGSCQDEVILQKVFGVRNVDIVYHAAAYKHVPIVEQNVVAGLINNIFGTNTVAQFADKFKVKKFVLVSTDKAVRPTNVMGASKRLAELIIQEYARSSETIFSVVRFGNVLGSSGSVIPKFKSQIDQGGPVTVTHPEITRYFMSIPEAAHLVINAGTLSNGGEIFLLDMGDPVKIVDLARSMIRQHGLQPVLVTEIAGRSNKDNEVLITFSGLRPGEKLYEELLVDGLAKATSNPKIFQSVENQNIDFNLTAALQRIRRLADANSTSDILEELSQFPLGYNSNAQPDNLQNFENKLDGEDIEYTDTQIGSQQAQPSMPIVHNASLLQKIGGSKFFVRILHYYFLFVRGMTLGVRILLQNPNGKILLVKHTYLQNWYLPGGGVDRGEDIYTAAIRELYEETGVSDCSDFAITAIVYNTTVSRKDHVVVLSGVTRQEVVDFRSFEVASAEFFELDSLPHDIDDLSLNMIRDMMNRPINK